MKESAPPSSTLDGLPEEIREGLQRFALQLDAAADGRLVSLVLYGGLARGEYSPRTSDVNVMAVFREVPVGLLDLVLPLLEQAKREMDLALMILDESDLATSADLFPTKFRDIQRRHRLICGRDMLGALEFTRERLKRQCARQIQNLQMRLRQLYLKQARRPELLERALLDLVSPFLRDLAVVLELRTGAEPKTKAEIMDEAARLGLEVAALRTLISLKTGAPAPDSVALKKVYGEFMQTVDGTERLVQTL